MTLLLSIRLGDRDSTYTVGGTSYVVPVGSGTLAAMLTADPPQPAELTNAVGLLVDHLEDVVREVPGSGMADTVEVCGAGLATLAAVEVGGPTTLPFTFSRPAAEEVFRTLATERRSDRARNPGLPADEVHHVLGVSCVVVALLRGLALQAITVTEG